MERIRNNLLIAIAAPDQASCLLTEQGASRISHEVLASLVEPKCSSQSCNGADRNSAEVQRFQNAAEVDTRLLESTLNILPLEETFIYGKNLLPFSLLIFGPFPSMKALCHVQVPGVPLE